jgi:hypothetical protein
LKILNVPTVTKNQCKEWIKTVKTANALALDLIDELYDCAVINGVDPAVLIAQAMLETGYFNYGGKMTAAYRNTCGLKAPDGKDYARFNTWHEGIMAHSDHLALYAGSSKTPKANSPDPKHYSSLHGVSSTVEGLVGIWASDSKYATKIITITKNIQATKVNTVPSNTCKPSTNGNSIDENSMKENITQINKLYAKNKAKQMSDMFKSKINNKKR